MLENAVEVLEGMGAAQLSHLRTASNAGTGARGTQATGEVRRRGIGIAVVRAIVAKHGGRIDAMSAPGAGTTVMLTLPLAQACQELQETVTTAQQIP